MSLMHPVPWTVTRQLRKQLIQMISVQQTHVLEYTGACRIP